MKKLVCELCGGSDFIKDKGVFLCLSCGLKYSLEEARRMMTECGEAEPSAPPVPFAPQAPAEAAAPKADEAPAAPARAEAPAKPAAPAKPSCSSTTDSYLIMAEKAAKEENNPKAEYYANKILELDSKSYRAWYLRGTAAGWQTTSRHNRYPESVASWVNAYENAPEGEKDALRDEITAAAAAIGSAIVQMELNRFRELRNQNNKDDVDNALAMVQAELELLNKKTGIEAFDESFRTTLARQLNSGAVSASNKADADFGPDNSKRDKYNWDNFTAAQDWCLNLLDKAYELTADDALCLQICKNYIDIAQEVRDSCSYRPQHSASGDVYVREYAFTAAAKASRTTTIDKWAERQRLYDPASRSKSCAKALELYNAKQDKGLRQAAIERYWLAHAEERAALEQERKALDKEQLRLETASDETANEATLWQIDRIVLALNRRLDPAETPGEKEAAALQAQIDELAAEKTRCQERWDAAKSEYAAQLRAIIARKSEIDAEFTRSRGVAERRSPKKTIVLAVDGANAATPRQIAEYIAAVVPEDVSVSGEGSCILENYSKKVLRMANMLSEDADAADAPYALNIYHLNFAAEGQEINAYASICGQSLDAPFITYGNSYLSFELNKEWKKPETVATFTRIVAEAVLGVCPSLEIPALVTAVVSAAYGIIPKTTLAADGFTVEVTGSGKSNTCVSLKPADD